MRNGTFITVLGSSCCTYDEGDDASSYVINNKLIVDTGWHLINNLRGLGLDPLTFKTVLMTHMHHDHYLALPQLLFWHLNAGKPLSELTFIGPGELAGVMGIAVDFLQVPRFYDGAGAPRCVEILPGDCVELERERLKVEAQRAIHPVDGRHYRITDMDTGAVVGLSGDTAYYPEEVAFFKGCDLLVHECALGGVKGATNDYQHSDARDAALVAAGAGAGTLMLTHYAARRRQECADAARSLFDGEILTPVKGDTIYIGSHICNVAAYHNAR